MHRQLVIETYWSRALNDRLSWSNSGIWTCTARCRTSDIDRQPRAGPRLGHIWRDYHSRELKDGETKRYGPINIKKGTSSYFWMSPFYIFSGIAKIRINTAHHSEIQFGEYLLSYMFEYNHITFKYKRYTHYLTHVLFPFTCGLRTSSSFQSKSRPFICWKLEIWYHFRLYHRWLAGRNVKSSWKV